MEKKGLRKYAELLTVTIILIVSLIGLGVSQVYSQTNPIANVMDNSQMIAETPRVTTNEQVTPTPTKDAFAIIKAYSQLGRPDLAYAQLQTAIVENPEQYLSLQISTPIPNDVIYKDHTDSPMVLKNKFNGFLFEGGYYTILKAFEATSISIFTGIFYVFLGYLLIKWVCKFFCSIFRCQFDIGDFEAGITIQCTPEEGFQALIEKEIWSLSDRNGLDNRLLIFEIQENPSFEKGMTFLQVKDVGVLLKILNYLFPPNIITLMGTLHYSQEKGGGVTLQLVKRKSVIIAVATLWQKDYDPGFVPSGESMNSECFYNLAEPAAYWLIWYFINNFDGYRYKKLIQIIAKKNEHYQTKIKKKLVSIFGTDNHDSAMFNYRGARFVENFEKRKEEALPCFYNSLDFDPNNRQALFNLATTMMRIRTEKFIKDIENNTAGDNIGRDSSTGNNKKEQENCNKDLVIDYSESILLLNTVIKLSYESSIKSARRIVPTQKIKQVEDADELISGVEKSRIADYFDSLLALTHYHLGAIGEYIFQLNDCHPDYGDALIESQRQFGFCQEILKNCIDHNMKRHDQKTVRKDDQKVRDNEKKNKNRNGKVNIRDDIKKMMEVAIESNSILVKIVSKNKEKVEKLKIEDNVMNISEKYNLACHYAACAGFFYSRKPEMVELITQNMERAKYYLNEVIENDEKKRNWSQVDPSLYQLRQWMEKKELKTILQKFKYPHPLDDLFNMSPVFVEKLIKISGLNNSDALLKTCATQAGRDYLFKRTLFDKDLILDWAIQADLMRIHWIDGSYAKLLIYCGVKSIFDLCNYQDEEILLETMCKYNDLYHLVERLPSKIELKKWIDDARKKSKILDYSKV